MTKKIFSASLVMGTLLIMNGCGGGSNNDATNLTPPAELTESEKVSLAKTTLEELRTQAISVVNYNESGNVGYLDTEALSLGEALKSCSLNTEDTGRIVSALLEGSFWRLDNNETHIRSDNEDGYFERNCTLETRTCTYEDFRDGVKVYSGTMVLPDLNDDVSAGNFTELKGTFNATFPTLLIEGGFGATQTVDLDLTVTRTATGADVELVNASLGESSTLVGISAMSIDTAFDVVEGSIEFKHAKLNSVTFNGECANYIAKGTLKSTDYVVNSNLMQGENENLMPSKLSFEGSFTNKTTSGKISGLIAVELKNAATLTEESVPEVLIGVDGALAIPERPEMKLGLTYENKVVTEATYHNFTADYSYNTMSIETEGVMDKEGENGQVDITANNGIAYKIMVEGGDILEGDAEANIGSIVTYNGATIGTIEYRSEVPIIKYIDGSFESIL